MAFPEKDLARKLAKKEKEIFQKYGLAYLPEAVIEMFDPYSITSNPTKTFWYAKNTVIRLYPDAKMEIEKIGKSEYIPKELAEEMMNNEIPYIPIGYTNLYDTKLEADLNRKPIIELPEKLEVDGAIIPYGQSILENLMLTVIEKLQKIRVKVTETDIIQALTTPPPEGAGWYKPSAKLIEAVKQKLEQLTWKGILIYDPRTMSYTLRRKPATSRIETL